MVPAPPYNERAARRTTRKPGDSTTRFRSSSRTRSRPPPPPPVPHEEGEAAPAAWIFSHRRSAVRSLIHTEAAAAGPRCSRFHQLAKNAGVTRRRNAMLPGIDLSRCPPPGPPPPLPRAAASLGRPGTRCRTWNRGETLENASIAHVAAAGSHCPNVVAPV